MHRYVGLFMLISMALPGQAQPPERAYYVDSRVGNDQNPGSQAKPLKTLRKLNTLRLEPGDGVYLKAGRVFPGTLLVTQSGTPEQPIRIASYGNGKAIIQAGPQSALRLQQVQHVTVGGLILRGAGRKDGNTEDGLAVVGCRQIVIDDLDIGGFQKAGLRIDSSSQVRTTRVRAHDNGFAGILVTGRRTKTDCQAIYLSDCRAENNPGDPTVFDFHFGNGILVGLATNVQIEYCAATNNGWDMPRTGNGPVGIWAFEADSVVIQHCVSYRNKTSPGGGDGGGFDFDGGVTNSIIQYCLSYENQGSGFGIFQYAGASPWNNNTLRYNISENDGLVSEARSGVHIWNSAGDGSQFTNCYVYNNVFYNEQGAAIYYASESRHRQFYVYNNILVGKDQLITGQPAGSDTFAGNNWYSLAGGFRLGQETDLSRWARRSGQEQRDGQLIGLNIPPEFVRSDQPRPTDPRQLATFRAYALPLTSPLRTRGIDLKATYGIDPGAIDFNQQPILPQGIGASFD